MFGFIAFGGLVFWALCAVATIALIFMVANDEFWLSVGAIAAVAYLFFGAADGGPTFNLSWQDVVLAVAAYFGLGLVYAIVSWTYLVRKIRAYVDAYVAQKGIRLTDRVNAEFNKYSTSRISIPPKPSQFSKRISMWIVYWPIKGVSYVVTDGVRAIGDALAAVASNFMMKISNAAFADYERPTAAD